MSDNWVVQILESSLKIWTENSAEIWLLLTQSPEEFRGGAIWSIITQIYGSLQAIGYSLLVLFFAIGLIKTCGSFAELKKPEHAVKLFVRFVLAKAAITYGLELLLAIMSIVQGILSTTMSAVGVIGDALLLPAEIITAIEECSFLESIPLWAVALLGCLLIWVLSFVMILTVYGRIFKLYMVTALAPIPLSTFAGEPTQSVGRSFLKSYCGVCLEGVVMVLACIIFSAFAGTSPTVDIDAKAATMVWKYIGELLFNMLVLVGTIKASDRVVHDIMGL